MPNSLAFISGASSGIGMAIARKFASEGINLIISARREERLQALADELKSKFGIAVHTLVLDVRNREDVLQQIGQLPAALQNIDILINNAGLASGLGPMHEGDIDDWEKMIDTNVKGLLYVSRAIAPLMKVREKGLIINIGSIAGKEVYANGNVYCATKHAVDALSKAMRIELSAFGVKVGQICPGAVETEFSVVRFHGDKERADKVYEGFDNLLAEDIADAAWFMASRPAHVNINDMVIMPTAQPIASIIHR
ncbi:MAG: SDR family NAD(P)-dependent oxidoreductase [Bacteroidetes bacterium]|nr:SDR family NAD(P)-dependent oxidoreductase [Bacteroidota bacterium]